MTGRLTPAEQLAALEECLAHCKPRRTPKHPETGCYCQPCIDRDMRMEARAEEMAAERRGDYEGLAGSWREYRQEMHDDYWSGS